MTALLGIEPTHQHCRGDPRPTPGAAPFRTGRWSFTTRQLESVDIRDHLDHLLGIIEPVAEHLARLQATGTRQDVFCFWQTDNGQGGPELDPSQMRRLAALELTIRFDCYLTNIPT